MSLELPLNLLSCSEKEGKSRHQGDIEADATKQQQTPHKNSTRCDKIGTDKA